MKQNAKKLKITITLAPEAAKKIRAEAEANYGGNFSKTINELIRGARGEIDELHEEREALHGVLIRLIEEKKLPPWLEVETGTVRVGGEYRAYVKSWRIRQTFSDAAADVARDIYSKTGVAPQLRKRITAAAKPQKPSHSGASH